MLVDNAGSSLNSPSEHQDDGAQSQVRRQYTLKGVEPETIELMRLAAHSQGAKIGHWVSARLKEAALQTLERDNRQQEVLRNLAGLSSAFDEPEVTKTSEAELQRRIARLEEDIREVLKGQRDLMHLVLSKVL